MDRAFRAEERAFLSRLALLKPLLPPAVREVAEPIAWGPLFDEAALATLNAFQLPLDEFTARALEAGMIAAVADLALEMSFTLEHPAAAAYLQERGAERVTRIRQTTRETLRAILGRAAEEGWSYQRTAKAIRERYRHFSKDRARNIAVFELGDAYEHGNMLVAKDLQDGGLEMQMSWLTVGDDRVRPEHRANQAEGWIPLDDAFSSGSDRPPTDPGCRCTLLMRRKPDE
jgi:SPP1 gp7 family putative phage head morphogenesis protein